MPVGVNHPAVAAYKGSLYVHGGYTGVMTEPIDRLFRYTPATDTWVELKNSGRPRAAHALVPIGGKLYAPGGADGQRAFRFLQIYDPPRDRWRAGPAMRVAREHIGAAAVGGKLYVIAGRAGGFNLDVVERYDPDTRRWKRLRPVQVPRSGFQAAVVGGPHRRRRRRAAGRGPQHDRRGRDPEPEDGPLAQAPFDADTPPRARGRLPRSSRLRNRGRPDARPRLLERS
jgi:hypothetical protein